MLQLFMAGTLLAVSLICVSVGVYLFVTMFDADRPRDD